MGEVRPKHYFIDPLAKFPPRWRDRLGPVNVMSGPVKGWLMVRRPGATPFCLRVSDLCNATKLGSHGPFEVIGEMTRTLPAPTPSQGERG